MTVLSVPLTPELANIINHLVKTGVASNKADLARKAIELFAEEHAVEMVMKAEKEANEGKLLEGDLDQLAEQL